MQQNFHIHNMLFLLLFSNAFIFTGTGSSKQKAPEQQAAIDGFMNAVTKDDVDRMREIVKTNPSVVSVDSREEALMLAARYGKMKTLRFMTSKDYGYITSCARANAVFYAIEGGHRDAIDFLIKSGVDGVSRKDIEKAAKEHKKEEVTAMLFKEDFSEKHCKEGFSEKHFFRRFELHEAIEHRDLEMLQVILNRDGLLFIFGYHFLEVVEKGWTDFVKEFLVYKTPSDSDALCEAFRRAENNGNIELMELLASEMKTEDIKKFVPSWARKLSREKVIRLIKGGISRNLPAIQNGFHINRFIQLILNSDVDGIEKTLSDEKISLDIRLKFARIFLDMTREKTKDTLNNFIKKSEEQSSK